MKIKICGIKRLEEAIVALDAGADMLGFNFYFPSSRYIEPADCAQLINQLHQKREVKAKLIGVFVNEPVAKVQEILDSCQLDMAQLCADEPVDMLTALSGKAFKAIRPATLAEAETACQNCLRRRN